MKQFSLFVMAGLALIGISACANRQTVQSTLVPPRVDLKQYELIGVVDFKSTSEGKLGPLATKSFTEWARRDQGPVRIVGLGSKAEALRSVGRDRLDRETFMALGREHGVSTILTGELKVSDIRPDIRILASLRSGEVSAEVDATLAVELIEASTGASIWSASASGTRSVGHISMLSGRNFAFDAHDPKAAYGGLVDALVEVATRDFRAAWVRQ